MPFIELGLGPNLAKAVREAGYTEPTPIQNRGIPAVLSGRDVIGIAQTGTGKTAAFVLPILQLLHSGPPPRGKRPRVLILAPTRELCVQIADNVKKYGKHLRISSVSIYGGVGEQPQIQALRAGAQIIIATPGRLIDLMQQKHADLSSIEIAVLDEADRMLDMGFLPPIRQIMRALPGERQTLLFSATLSKEIEGLTSEFQSKPLVVEVGKRANPAETVTQHVYEVPKSRKLPLLVHLLKDETLDSVLVFSRTKHGADKIARRLTQSGINTATLHANRSQNQRLQALRGFKTGEVRVLVATDIAARGIDVEGISHVINFDFPPQPEDYVHRIGRTGRAKAIGDAISFVSQEDQAALRSLERFISRGIPRKKAADFDYSERVEPQEVALARDAAARYRAQRPFGTSYRSDSRSGGRPQRSDSGRGPTPARAGKPSGSTSRSPHGSTTRPSTPRAAGSARPSSAPGRTAGGAGRSTSRPAAGRPAGGRPSSGRPSGGRPSARPSGGRPGGGGGGRGRQR
jgi:ATP-dependent RNA helicase RhlE